MYLSLSCKKSFILESIKSIIILTILLMFSLQQFFESGLVTYISVSIVGLSLIALVFLYKISYIHMILILVSIIFLFFFKIISGYFTANPVTFNSYVALLTFFILSLLILSYDKNYLILKNIYYFLFSYVLFIFMLLISGTDPNEIWLNSSRNTTSLIFVTLGAVFLIQNQILKEVKYPIVFYFLVVFVSILSLGRSGIITSIILFLTYIIFLYKEVNNKNQIFLFLAFFVLSVLLFLNFKIALNSLMSSSNFEYLLAKGITDDSRSIMLQEFINYYNFNNFLFGMNLLELPYISSFNGNPHNSYIDLHSKFGFLALFIYIGIIFSLIKFIYRFRYIELLASVVILLRLSTDSAFGVIIFPLIYLCVYGFYSKNFIKNNN